MKVRSVASSTRAPSTASTASVSRGQSPASPVSTVMSRIVCVPVDLDEVDGADRAAGLADRARDLAEHPGQVVDLDAQREAVLGAGCGGHRGARSYASNTVCDRPTQIGSDRMPDELFLIDGNSLAYRAFFALPESIATSTGVPTNAIFGFASMLVKILTDYGPKATVVVWDAGYTGPQGGLRRVQGPALQPPRSAQGAVAAPRAAGRRVRLPEPRVEGYEADDVIASIAERRQAAGPADRGDGRDRRPRRLPARRRRGVGS